MTVVQTLEARYLPLLRQTAARLRERHPTFTVNAGSGPVGSLTTYQGHNLYVEADRPNSADPEPNCVALEICVRDVPGTPILCGLGVAWGADGIPPATGGFDPLGVTEIVFGPQALQAIDDALPELERHLDRCLSDWEIAYPLR
jgi:hypothetical protein